MMDAATRELVRSSFGHLLERSPPIDIVAALLTSGWEDLAADDERAAVALLFEEHGRLRASSGALDLVVLRALDLAPAPTLAVVYPCPSLATATTVSTPPADSSTVQVEGVLLGRRGAMPSRIVVLTDVAANPLILTMPVDDLQFEERRGLDSDLGLVVVTGRADTAQFEEIGGSASRSVDAVAAARRALAHELVGLGQAVLDLVVDHVVVRHQFGHPIAAFQTVRHRLAEVHVALEAARVVLDAAWDSRTELPAACAKALAGRAFSLAARHGQQLTGGTGFLADFPLHRFVRRGAVLDELLGNTVDLQAHVGASLLAAQTVPRFPQLSGGRA